MANFYKLCTIFEHYWLTINCIIRINSLLQYYLSKTSMTKLYKLCINYVTTKSSIRINVLYTRFTAVSLCKASRGNPLYCN